jgi:hypothetical protein
VTIVASPGPVLLDRIFAEIINMPFSGRYAGADLVLITEQLAGSTYNGHWGTTDANKFLSLATNIFMVFGLAEDRCVSLFSQLQ